MGMMDGMMGGGQMPQQAAPQGGMMDAMAGKPSGGGTPPDEIILNEMQSLTQNPAPQAVHAFAQKLMRSDNPAAKQFAQKLMSIINDPDTVVQLISQALPAIRAQMQQGM